VEARLTRAWETLEALNTLGEQVAAAHDLDGLETLSLRLDARRARRQRARGPGRGRTTPREPYLTFTSADGVSILVGRSAQDNHRLTFHHARGRDIWLHTRDRPGSHGIIRMDRDQRQPPHQTLLDAATLVAFYSKVKPGESVDVTYTERKHVRPGAAGRPGQVYVSGGHTLSLTLEEKRLGRLLGRDVL